MRITRILAVCTILMVPAVRLALGAQAPQAGGAPAPPMPGLTLTSPAFEDGTVIPAKFTQSVTDFVSPKLEWSHVPANTVSFVLIFHDPTTTVDKKSEDFLHWLAFNIPGTARELPENVPPSPQLPDGTVQSKNTRASVGYRGPGAGPAGPYHDYTFELYALDTKLSLGPDATRADVLKAMDGHVLGKGSLVGRFHR